MKRKRGKANVFERNPPFQKVMEKWADSELTDAEFAEKVNAVALKRNLQLVPLPTIKYNRRVFLKSVDEEIKSQRDNLAIIERFGKELEDNGGVHVLKTLKMIVQNAVTMLSINMNSTGELLEGETDEQRLVALQKSESMTRMLESLTRTEKNLQVMVSKVKEEMAAALIEAAKKQAETTDGTAANGVEFVKRLIEQVNANNKPA